MTSPWLCLRLTYHPETDTLDIEARPDACTRVRVGGSLRFHSSWDTMCQQFWDTRQ